MMTDAVRDQDATPFNLREFVEEGGERLRMTVAVGGRGLEREVLEPMTNRPGLALTGYYGDFAWRRLQVIGQAEQGYLDSLPPETRLQRLKALFDRQAYCLIYTCGTDISPDIAAIAEAAGAVILKTELLTRVFSHQCTFVLERLGAPKMHMYGTTVEVAGLGVMLEGAPGLGKSETALGLIKRGGNALVADDFTCLRKDVATNTLFASAAEATRNHMEIRGIGIIHVPSIFGVTAVCPEKRLDLVITLKSMKETEGELDRTGQERMTRTILGVDIPQLIIPVAAGRDMVNLVETAAQHYKLLAAGYDAAAELDAQLCARAEAKLKLK